MQLRAGTTFALVAIFASLGLALHPHARLAGALLLAKDDPATLADIHLDHALADDPTLIARNIDDALTAGDADLAASLVAVAKEKRVALPDELVSRVTTLVAEQGTVAAIAGRVASGALTGQADDFASLSGAVAGDMFAYGDIRDAVVEGRKVIAGEEADRIILGLAAAGVAMTAVTYATAGGSVPVRAGLTLVKDARRVGRLSTGMAGWIGRVARETVDTPALQAAVSNISMTRPAEAAAAVRAAFHAEKAGVLFRVAKDVGRVGQKAGTRGALDALKVAENPGEIARAARLAEAKGGQTRALFKLLGRGALLLLVGTLQLSWWVLGFVLMLISMLMSIKAASERLSRVATVRWRVWRDARAASRSADEAKQKLRGVSINTDGAENPALAGPTAPV